MSGLVTVGSDRRDRRLVEQRAVHTPWTLTPPGDLASWQARAAHIRARILATTGLLPLPEPTPLKARVFGRVEGDGYSVEKVHFESLPGLFVCGNLYRPLEVTGLMPGIACPHGHWRAGRLADESSGSVPGRGIGLARLGCVAFAYDMVGYNDSAQIDHRRFGGPRQELWGIGQLGLQLWNSIRAVDFLTSLADVDSKRIAMTGASGGGSQTFLLTAVDDRVAAAAPVNMVSAHMQGGCVCENQPHLRLDVNNVEIVACMAPRPLMMVSASGDWTAHTPYHEYPAVRRVYQLYGAADVVHEHQVDAGHNYNRASREAVYGFFRRYLLGGSGAVRERPFQVPEPDDLLVFPRRPRSGKPRLPARALSADGIVEALIRRTARRNAALVPRDAAGLRRLCRDLGPAFAHSVSSRLPLPGEVVAADRGRDRVQARGDELLYERFALHLDGSSAPGVLVSHPRARRGPAFLLVAEAGKDTWFTDGGRPRGLAATMLAAGHRVLTIDPFLIGEASAPAEHPYPDPDCGHFLTYNPAPAAARVQDVLTALAFLHDRPDTSRVCLAGTGDAGLLCLFARAVAGPRVVAAACAEVTGFRFDDDQHWVTRCPIPGLRAAGDVSTAVALAAPSRLAVHGASPRNRFPVARARAAYRAAGDGRALTVAPRRWSVAQQSRWLTG